MPDLPKLISRKLLPKIFFHFSNQGTKKLQTYLLQCTNKHPQQSSNTNGTTKINLPQRIIFDPITLAIPHPMTVLLPPFVLVSFDLFYWLLPFHMFPLVVVLQIEPILMVFYWDKHLKSVVLFYPLDVLYSRHGQYCQLHTHKLVSICPCLFQCQSLLECIAIDLYKHALRVIHNYMEYMIVECFTRWGMPKLIL